MINRFYLNDIKFSAFILNKEFQELLKNDPVDVI